MHSTSHASGFSFIDSLIALLLVGLTLSAIIALSLATQRGRAALHRTYVPLERCRDHFHLPEMEECLGQTMTLDHQGLPCETGSEFEARWERVERDGQIVWMFRIQATDDAACSWDAEKLSWR